MDGDGLCAHVIGVRTPESTIAYWESIVDKLATRRPAWLLVMDELRGEELSASEWKALVGRMRGRGLEGLRIAHVKPFAMDQVEYCEKYANLAGLDSRAFRGESEAMGWLRSGDESSPGDGSPSKGTAPASA